METESRNHQQWLNNFNKKKKAEKRRNILISLSSLIILLILSFLIYYSLNDELKFIGKDTKLISGKILTERKTHIGEGLYLQVGKYEYEIKGKKYISEFKSKDFKTVYNPKEYKVGDIVIIKISIKNPEVSKFIE